MNFTFLKATGEVAFFRSDAEQADWTQEEFSLHCLFPYVADKVIERGMTVLFQDPATNDWQAYEIRQCEVYPGDYYQQFTAEDIAVSELTDCHVQNEIKFTNTPATVPLDKILKGTGWNIGTVSIGNVAEQQEIIQQINALRLNGNVDLTNRPIISPEVMHKAGYTEIEEGYCTLYSMTYYEKAGNGQFYTTLFTPIHEDGSVFSQDEIDDYVFGLYDDATSAEYFKTHDSDGLLMHVLPGEQIDRIDQIAETAHDLSADWEDCTADDSSSGNINRGSVWQGVSVVQQNWNVYVMPRVTVGQNGITGRFLDVMNTSGFDRGLRLAVNKNVTDPCVTYDDTDMFTALYGYGGTYSTGKGTNKQTQEYTFKDVAWSKTDDHPAKPAGQLYLEDPEATALYGRNGKPRFGFYQNTDIKNPDILLEKTWETLKSVNHPKISISGTVADLKRLGYVDQPLRLHDMAIIELEPVGILLYKQIIQLTVDLLNPDKNLPTIGDYIPNIIYINRDTEKTATGGSKGAGKSGGTKVDLEFDKYRTDIYDTGREVGMYARIVDEQGNILQQAGMHIDPETGVLIYAEDTENMVGSKFRVQSDRITAEVKARTQQGDEMSSRITQTANAISLEVSERKQGEAALSSRINQTANEISLEVTRATEAEQSLSGQISVQADKIGLVVTQKDGHDVVDAASIVLGINSQTGSYIKLQAKTIDIDGIVTSLGAKDLGCANLTVQNDVTTNGNISTEGYIFTESYIWADSVRVGDQSTGATWKSKTVVTGVTRGNTHRFVYSTDGSLQNLSTEWGTLVTAVDDTTIYYLGR